MRMMIAILILPAMFVMGCKNSTTIGDSNIKPQETLLLGDFSKITFYKAQFAGLQSVATQPIIALPSVGELEINLSTGVVVINSNSQIAISCTPSAELKAKVDEAKYKIRLVHTVQSPAICALVMPMQYEVLTTVNGEYIIVGNGSCSVDEYNYEDSEDINNLIEIYQSYLTECLPSVKF